MPRFILLQHHRPKNAHSVPAWKFSRPNRTDFVSTMWTWVRSAFGFWFVVVFVIGVFVFCVFVFCVHVCCVCRRYSNVEGVVQCTECDPGACLRCVCTFVCAHMFCVFTGKYQPNNASLSCIECGAGTFSLAAGVSACVNCPVKTYIGKPQPHSGLHD